MKTKKWLLQISALGVLFFLAALPQGVRAEGVPAADLINPTDIPEKPVKEEAALKTIVSKRGAKTTPVPSDFSWQDGKSPLSKP